MRKNIIRLPGLLIILTLSAGAAIYIAFPDRADQRRLPSFAGKGGARPQIAMTHVHQTHISQGEKKWVLTADTAQLAPDGNLSTLEDIVLTAFKASGPPVRITADQGVFNRETRHMMISGNVVIKDENYTIHTPSLHYQNETGIIYTTDPVTIDGDAIHLKGSSMKYDVDAMEAILTGGVQGVIKEAL